MLQIKSNNQMKCMTHNEQLGFSPKVQAYLNIPQTIHNNHHITKINEVKTVCVLIIIDAEKSIRKIQHPLLVQSANSE
jgi:hypothetical protein